MQVIWRRHCLRPLPGFLYFSTSKPAYDFSSLEASWTVVTIVKVLPWLCTRHWKICISLWQAEQNNATLIVFLSCLKKQQLRRISAVTFLPVWAVSLPVSLLLLQHLRYQHPHIHMKAAMQIPDVVFYQLTELKSKNTLKLKSHIFTKYLVRNLQAHVP